MSIVALMLSWPGKQQYVARYSFEVNAVRAVDPQSEALRVGVAYPKERKGKAAAVEIRDGELVLEWIVSDYETHVILRNNTGAVVSLGPGDVTFAMEREPPQPCFVTDDERGGSLSPPGPLSTGKSVALDIFPRDRARIYGKETYGKDQITSKGTLFDPPGYAVGDTPAEIIAIATVNIGKSFEFVLPLRVGDETREYRFRFRVTRVDARGFRDTF